MSIRRRPDGEPVDMDEDEARILRREYELEHGLEDDWESAQTGYEKWLNRSLDGGGG